MSTPRSATTARTCTSVTRALPAIAEPDRSLRAPSAEHDDRGDRDQQHRQRDGRVGVGFTLQVDLQRQRPGDALARARERQRGAELAQRAGERQHRSRDQAGRQKRQGHPPPHRRRSGTERRRHHVVVTAGRACRTFQRDDQERQRHEGLRQHHRRRGERDPDARGVEVLADQARAGRTRTAARYRPPPAAAPAAAGAAAGSPASARPSLRASTSAIGTPNSTHSSVLAAAVFRLSTSAARRGLAGDQRPELRPVHLRRDGDERQHHEQRPRLRRGGRSSAAAPRVGARPRPCEPIRPMRAKLRTAQTLGHRSIVQVEHHFARYRYARRVSPNSYCPVTSSADHCHDG